MKLTEQELAQFTNEQLRELGRMKRAYNRGSIFMYTMGGMIRSRGLRFVIEQVKHEADVAEKHHSSAEVALSFLAGMTVGAFKAGHTFMFPSIPNIIDVEVPPNIQKKGS